MESRSRVRCGDTGRFLPGCPSMLALCLGAVPGRLPLPLALSPPCDHDTDFADCGRSFRPPPPSLWRLMALRGRDRLPLIGRDTAVISSMSSRIT
mmetsp:Transcript_69449/g.164846  ORF Transcript_69449/g.164846 Transcript_69449/m.164846 type:complete len:95 (-) Transcript_69449:265-549(-)